MITAKSKQDYQRQVELFERKLNLVAGNNLGYYGTTMEAFLKAETQKIAISKKERKAYFLGQYDVVLCDSYAAYFDEDYQKEFNVPIVTL